jgi:hypothetical protein
MLNFEDYKNQAEFNGGLAQIFRMDAWAKLSAKGLLFSDPDQRYKGLVLYFNECYGTDTKKDRKIKMMRIFVDIESQMVRYWNTSKSKHILYHDHPDYFLQRWELFLREWAQMLGLGMKKASDGTFALME